MADQEKIKAVSDEVAALIEFAKIELVKDLLKLKAKVSTEEYVKAISNLDMKAVLLNKLKIAKLKFIEHHKTILEETIPFGDI